MASSYRAIPSRDFIAVLIARKIVPPTTTGVVIEAKDGGYVRIHYEAAASRSILRILPAFAESAEVKTESYGSPRD